MHTTLTAWAAAACALLPPLAMAGSLAVSPLRVDLGDTARTAAVTLRNGESSDVVMQVQAYLWEQEAGEERLTETQDLIVSPVVFTLQGDGSQLVRVALRRAVDPSRELSYRLVLQEVPQEASPDFTGLSVALKLSLPVFVQAGAPTAPKMLWSAATDADGNLVVTAHNEGTAHMRLLGFEVSPGGGHDASPTLNQPAAAYLLPGQWKAWTLQPEGDSAPGTAVANWPRLRLKARSAQGDIETELALAGR